MPRFDFVPPAWLQDKDLRFVIENLPEPGTSYDTISRTIHQFPQTLEHLLQSDRLFERVFENTREFLDISPFLLFSILVRRALRENRVLADPRVVNYLANLLTIFATTSRLYRIHPRDFQQYQYVIDMLQEGLEADDSRRFQIHAHIGNYTLFLTGIFPNYLEVRQRYYRRPVGIEYYKEQGRTHYELASHHPLAREFALDEVFFRLSIMFDVYQESLSYLSRHYLRFDR